MPGGRLSIVWPHRPVVEVVNGDRPGRRPDLDLGVVAMIGTRRCLEHLSKGTVGPVLAGREIHQVLTARGPARATICPGNSPGVTCGYGARGLSINLADVYWTIGQGDIAHDELDSVVGYCCIAAIAAIVRAARTQVRSAPMFPWHDSNVTRVRELLARSPDVEIPRRKVYRGSKRKQ